MKRSRRLTELRFILRALDVQCSWFGVNVLSINYEGLEVFFKEVDEQYVEVSFWRIPGLTFLIYGTTGADVFMGAKRNHVFTKSKLYAFVA